MKDVRVSSPLKLKNTSCLIPLSGIYSSEKELVAEDIDGSMKFDFEIDLWILDVLFSYCLKTFCRTT